MYTFEETKLIAAIKERKSKRILLQLPEGLKKEGFRLSSYIQEHTKTEVILSGEPCWGACDVAINEAKALKADLIVLYGHAPFFAADFPILYLEARYEKDITSLMKQSAGILKDYGRVGVVSSVQHLHHLPLARDLFEKKGKTVVIPGKKGHAFYDGQVLGCEYNGLKTIVHDVDAFLVIANKFHALGAALALQKPVYSLDPFNEEIESMEPLKQAIIKQRFATIEKAKKAEIFGVLIGLKPGQTFGSFDLVKKKLEDMGKKYALITMREVTPDKLINLYDIDAFIELACPRIAIEDVTRYPKAVLTLKEFLVLSGELTWEQLLESGFL